MDVKTSAGAIGSRIGAYRIIGEVGSGGMGDVYLAVRDDDQYRKRVAIKLIRRGMDSEEMLARFRHERQILANLDHPFISRLLDGGTTADGRPFLVMEYVEGAPLDEWGRGDAELRERCRLFLKICEAVAYAHSRLVVHRDLKPGNILITGDGSPKLLDFGIAKLVDASAGTGRTLLLRPLTPDYASPELIRDEPITTAADVYSLGAILYELLSGVRAQRFASYTPREVERVICESEPARMSQAAGGRQRQLRGDLDAIAAMAMRKEPAARYRTVEELAADLQRYLDGAGVAARQGSVAYRARTFVRRNRVALAAGVVLAGVLIAGAAASAVEANRAAEARARAEMERAQALEDQGRAEGSRQQAERAAAEARRQRGDAETEQKQAELERAEAESQRRRADRRFQQVRELAGRFLNEFQDSLYSVPGSAAARKMVIETGLKYYDSLAQEAHADPELLQEIARGYDHLGDVQGNYYVTSLGDMQAAMASYRKAAEIRARIKDPSTDLLADQVDNRLRMAQIQQLRGDVKGARRELEEIIAEARKQRYVGSKKMKDILAGAYCLYGDGYQSSGEYGRALEPYRNALETYEELERAYPAYVDSAKYQSGIAAAHNRLAKTYRWIRRDDESYEHARSAVEVMERLTAGHENNLPWCKILLTAYYNVGEAFRYHPDLTTRGEQERVLRGMVDLADRVRRETSPEDKTTWFEVATAQTVMGDWLRDTQQDAAGAAAAYRRAMEAIEQYAAGVEPRSMSYEGLIVAYQRLASALVKSGRAEEALEYAGKGAGIVAEAEKTEAGSAALAGRKGDVMATRAAAYAALRRWDEAIDGYAAAIRLFEELQARDPANGSNVNEQAILLAALADCYAAAGQREKAAAAMERALAKIGEIGATRRLSEEEEQLRAGGPAKVAEWRSRGGGRD